MSRPDPAAPDAAQEAEDRAWRIHAALVNWTGSADSKASFVLTLESGVLAVVIGLSSSGHALHSLHGLWPISYWAGVTLLAVAITLAASVFAPRVGRRALKGEHLNNLVYFGHLRYWKPADLAAALTSSDPLPMLSRQLIVMSKIAWTKHELVGLSLLAGLLGSGCVTLAGWLG